MAEQTEAPKPVASGPVVVKLRKAVHGGDGTDVMELTFREPTGGDIAAAGIPVSIDMLSSEKPQISFVEGSMEAMMARLAAVPPSSIKALHPRDWVSIAWRLAPFFIPDL